jgi:hypothetical protein
VVKITIQSLRLSHVECLEVRALADVRRKLRQLVHPDLKHVTWGQITIQSLRLSHVERLEVRALADVRRKLRELVVADLKKNT